MTILSLAEYNGAESILSVMSAAGVKRIFASPGSEWAPLWEALSKSERAGREVPDYSSVGHEELAVAMASGYAKASGELPAVVIHTTVGVLHAAMAMRAALHEQTPMVVLAGESVAFGEDDGPDPGAQWLAHLTDLGGPSALVERSLKWSARVPHPSLLPSMVARACRLAEASPPGPVMLSVPMEYLFAEARGEVSVPARSPRPSADDDLLCSCAERLLEAQHPLIVTEEAGRTEAGVRHLIRLAELIGAPVVETRGARFMNFPRRHPLHGGFDPTELTAHADEILLCGVLAPWHPSSRSPSPRSSITVLRENPLRTEVPYWGYPVAHVIEGAIEPSLGRILQFVEKRGDPGIRRQERAEEVAIANEHRRAEIETRIAPAEQGEWITPRLAAAELGKALPSDAIIVDETLTARRALLEHIDPGPGGFFSGAIGGLGTGLGTALGVKKAEPDRLVLCTIGEGSFAYEPTLAALMASRGLDLPILVVIMNNLGYLSQKAALPRYFPTGSAVSHGDYTGLHLEDHLDFVLLADAVGGHGEIASHPLELTTTIERAVKEALLPKLTILDVRLQPTSSLTSRGD